MNIDQVVARCQAAGVRLVRFLYCDNGCTIRGKLVPMERLAGRMASGQGLTVAMQAMNMLDQLQPVEGMGPVGEIRLVPDPDSLVILPYAPNSAAMMCDMITLDRQPWEACPRSFLQRMIDRLNVAGMSMQAAMEGEFSLFREESPGVYMPIDTGLCFSSISMTAAAEVADAMVAAFEAQGIPVDAYYPELGHGQHEMPLRHASVLRAADNQIWFRETIRNVAAQHGMIASLTPKPMPDQAGNGSHVHFSLWDPNGCRSLLYDPDNRYLLSETGYHFLAGVLAHLPGLLALTTPSFNSFRRLQPHFWSSAYTAWGPDNREAAVRIASGLWGSEAISINLELKACDASSNPYLALGGLIAAGLDGIARKLDAGDPVLVDPGNLSEAQRVKNNIRRYPTTQSEALDALEADQVLMDALGGDLARAYVTVKRSEYAAFSEATSINLELKACDASSNPYLALGGLIAAGLDGIERKLDPGDPVWVDPGNLSEAERVKNNIRRYPTTQSEALDALEADQVLMDALGADLARAYVTVKRSEYAAFSEADVDFEIKHHIYKF